MQKAGIDYIGVCVVVWTYNARGHVLLHRRGPLCRDENGCWDICAGSLEFGETPEECMRREVAEEIGVEVISSQLLGTRNVLRRTGDSDYLTHWVSIDYKALIEIDRPRIIELGKADEIAWFSPFALPYPLSSPLSLFATKYSLAPAMGV